MQPKVAIIYLTFPTKNWEEDIERAMRSFEKLSYPKDRLELICVESKGSRPSVKEWFERTWMPKSGATLPRITYIFRDEEIGFSGNNNLGFEKAKELGCEYVHLTNEDTEVDPDYLVRAVERAESDSKIGAVQSLLLLGQDRDRINSAGNAFHFLGHGYSTGYREPVTSYQLPVTSDEIGYASGAAVLVRVSAIEGNLFDEKLFSYHEDTDLSLGLRSRGFKIVLEPKSVVWHWYEFAKAKINFYWMERNRYVLVFSYYRWWTLLLVLPALIGTDLATALLSIRGPAPYGTGRGGWWDMKRKVYGDLLSRDFWKWIGKRRRSIRASRTIGDRELLRLVVASIEFQEAAVQSPIVTYVGNPILKAYWWVVRRLIV
ncbi:MAG: glycosyltransferase family 2 protein [Patescibacteria group bacterium]